MLVHRQKVWGKSVDRKQVERREVKTRRLGMGPEGEREGRYEEQPANKGRARSEGREEERKQEQRVSSMYGESVNGSGSVGFGGLSHQSLADMATEGSPHIHGVWLLPPFSVVLARRNKGEHVPWSKMFQTKHRKLDDIIRLVKVTSHGS
ncbi:hypothetical protein QR685DRAFT_575062 [Neurospora intermedia]|uniref:Uncharacterized protein n=1 Tax=Neurospora intermedia TaxID=5142 RepID=A0ABR3D306_NEUIN